MGKTQANYMKPDLEQTLLTFALLCTQSELYGYALKGNVNAQFSHKLKKYLQASNNLMKFINQHIDSEDLENQSEEIALFIETLTKKQ
jgi:hypothetical protein